MLTLQGCTTFTHIVISYLQVSTPFKGCRRGCSPQLLPHSRSSPWKPPTWVGYHYREPGRFTEVDPGIVCVVRKPVLDEPFSHLPTRPQAYQKSILLRHLDIEGDELVSFEGSVRPMCDWTLLHGSPHKNLDLGRCSTRQPIVYSYTTSHRSPCLGQIKQHISTIIMMITTIPTHIKE